MVGGSSAQGFSAGGGEADLPIPSPGADTPADPNLLSEPCWLANTLCLAGGGGGCDSRDHSFCSCVAAVYVGGGSLGADRSGPREFCLGGSRGGRMGIGGFVAGAGLATLSTLELPSPLCRIGGLGRLFVFSPVLSALYGTGGGAGLRAACSSDDL